MKIQLNAYEATAYWWTKRIKSFVDDIAIKGYANSQEDVDFVQPFFRFRWLEYRKFYLELTKKIQGQYESTSKYAVSTRRYRNENAGIMDHIREILGENVPSVTLNPPSTLGYIISIQEDQNGTPTAFAQENGMMVSSIRPLPNCVESDYILTGDPKLIPTNPTEME